MAISKIILNGVTQMDLTNDTTDASKTLASYTGHRADGEAFVGAIVDGDELEYGSSDYPFMYIGSGLIGTGRVV